MYCLLIENEITRFQGIELVKIIFASESYVFGFLFFFCFWSFAIECVAFRCTFQLTVDLNFQLPRKVENESAELGGQECDRNKTGNETKRNFQLANDCVVGLADFR